SRLRFAGQEQHAARLRRVTRAKLEQRFVGRERTLEEQFDASAGRPSRKEARLDDARVVEHDNIAVIYKARKVRECEVFADASLDVQQPAVAAPYSGRLRNEPGRKVVVEIRERERAHSGTGLRRKPLRGRKRTKARESLMQRWFRAEAQTRIVE